MTRLNFNKKEKTMNNTQKNWEKIEQGLESLFGDIGLNAVQIKGYKDVLQNFDWKDAMQAARHFSNYRHEYKMAATRWPYVGELRDILKKWNVEPSVFDNLQLPSRAETDFKASVQSFGGWYSQWMQKYPEHPLVKPERAMYRQGEFNKRVQEFWDNSPELQKSFKGCLWHVRATLFYQRGLHKEFEEWMITGEETPLPENPTEYMKEKLKKYS